MNLYAILAVVILWGASLAGSFFYGTGVGKDGEIANQAKLDKAITDTRTAAFEGAADAISKLKVRNTTIRGQTETIVRENVVYRDCVHGPDGLSRINEALTGQSKPTGDRPLP